MTSSRDLLRPGVNIIIDGQWGSTGKGKLAAYLAGRSTVTLATSDLQANAGHTVVLSGKKYVTRHLPCSFVNREARIFLSAACTIDLPVLLAEIEALESFGVQNRLRIHPRACVIEPRHAGEEKRDNNYMASTMKGVGAAAAEKMRRLRTASLAGNCVKLARRGWIGEVDVVDECQRGGTVLAETAQGFDLSLNHGHLFPYVTSRDVTTGATLSNLAVAPTFLRRVWGSLRAYPIRVGNTEGGWSGPHHQDQHETNWQLLGVPPEITTVTGRVRRVFSWSEEQFYRFVRACGPTDLFLNFANYIDPACAEIRTPAAIPEAVMLRVKAIERQVTKALWGSKALVRLIGTGADDADMVDMLETVPAGECAE